MAERRPHRRETTPRVSEATTTRAKAPSAAATRRAKAQATVRPAATARQRGGRRLSLRGLAVAFAVVLALAVAGAIALVVLSHTDTFTIASIDAEATEHVSAEDIAALAGVPEGTTLLNYDEDLIVSNLRRNPWVADVSLSRAFPDRLRVSVTERRVGSLVMLNAGSVIWCLGTDGVWIEPMKVAVGEDQSLSEAALATAVEMGAMLVTDVPQTVSPVAGQPAEDDVFEAMAAFREELSAEFWEQIVSFDAPSVEGISCMLRSGLEVSLGAPTSIANKEAVIQQLLAKYPNRLTYINVRVPTNPSYRMVDTEAVEEGTGVVGGIPVDPVAAEDAGDDGDASAGAGEVEGGAEDDVEA